MSYYGLLAEEQSKLDVTIALTPENYLSRYLQTLVFKAGMPNSIHHTLKFLL